VDSDKGLVTSKKFEPSSLALVPDRLAVISYQTSQRRRADNLGSVDVQALDRVAKAAFGLVRLDLEDLFDIRSRGGVPGEDLEFGAGCIWHIVGFQDSKAGRFADFAIHQPVVTGRGSRTDETVVLKEQAVKPRGDGGKPAADHCATMKLVWARLR